MVKLAFPHFEEELQDEIARSGQTRLYEADENIVKKGDTLRIVHIILDGCAKVCQVGNEGGEFIVAYLKPGNSFGVSISDDSPQVNKTAIVSLTAIEPTHVLSMSFSDKDALARKYDRWYKYILQTSVMYYKFYMDLVDSIAFQNLDSRIEFFLKRLSSIKNTSILQISHQEIANGLNSSREVVSRLLKKMENAGKIKAKHNTITIISQL